MQFLQYSRLLIGSIIVAILGVGGAMLVPPEADMHIEPKDGVYTIGDTFVVDIIVTSQIPVNVFQGDLSFNADVVYVDSIDYNTSIADLWAKRPWYQNGDGTLNFIGGTTRTGGFIGTGKIISITFGTKAVGDAMITVQKARILKHDGLGSDATLTEPIDTLFTVAEAVDHITVLKKNELNAVLRVIPDIAPTDLNKDGKQTLADMSIFLGYFASRNIDGDINSDGKVNMTDMSIMLDAK